MIVVIGGIKGGTGKTTLATNLVVIGSKLVGKVLLVDADEQRSASDWADQREESEFPTIALSGRNIHHQLLKFKQDYKLIFVDTGGRDTVNQRSALSVADIFVIPFKPRSLDIWTVGKVNDIIEEAKTVNPALRVHVCLNQADPRGSDNRQAIQILCELSERGEISMLGHRKAYANMASLGKGVYEQTQDTKARQEMEKLYLKLSRTV